MAEKLITDEEINNLVAELKRLIMFLNSAHAIRYNPNVYNDRPTQEWSCHRYHPAPSAVPNSYKTPKYLLQSNDFNMPVNNATMVRSEHFNILKTKLLEAFNRLKNLYSHPEMTSKPDNVPAETLSVSNTIMAKLDHINAVIQSISTIANTLKQVNGWYNSATDLCNLSCQNYCQVGCQVACQNVNWCHNQKCGIH